MSQARQLPAWAPRLATLPSLTAAADPLPESGQGLRSPGPLPVPHPQPVGPAPGAPSSSRGPQPRRSSPTKRGRAGLTQASPQLGQKAEAGAGRAPHFSWSSHFCLGWGVKGKLAFLLSALQSSRRWWGGIQARRELPREERSPGWGSHYPKPILCTRGRLAEGRGWGWCWWSGTQTCWSHLDPGLPLDRSGHLKR